MNQAGDTGHLVLSYFTSDWVELVDAAKRFETGQPRIPLAINQPKLCLNIVGGWRVKNAEELVEFTMVIYTLIKYNGIIPGFMPDNVAMELGVEQGVHLPHTWAVV